MCCNYVLHLINKVSDPFFIPPAHAIDDLQLTAGAEAEYVSVGAEGSHWVGADPRGAEPTVSLPSGYFPAAILTCHSILPVHLSTTDTQTAPAGPQLTTWGMVVLWFPSSRPPYRLLSWRGGVLTLGTCEMLWSYDMKRLHLSLFRHLRSQTLLTMWQQIIIVFLRVIMENSHYVGKICYFFHHNVNFFIIYKSTEFKNKHIFNVPHLFSNILMLFFRQEYIYLAKKRNRHLYL